MKKFLICIGLALSLSACGSDHIMRFNLNQQQNITTKPSYKAEATFSSGECGKKQITMWPMYVL